MKIIKKTTLIAAITAMAAFAVPAMASAAVWGPLNTNQSLDSTAVGYGSSSPTVLPFTCTGQHLGVHVRTPASSSLDVTSASWSGCTPTGPAVGCPITAIVPTGLPWTAMATSSTTASLPIHAQVTFAGGCGVTVNVDGTVSGTWTASTHTLAVNSSGLTETYMGTSLGNIGLTGNFRNPTQTLTLT